MYSQNFLWRRHVGVPLRGTNMAARNHQKHLLPVLQWKRELSLEELTQSKDCPQNKLLFLTYMTNSSLRNSSVLYHKRGPARGWGVGGPMSPVWILKRLVSVFINACRLLSGLLSLSQFGRGRLSLVAISFYTLSLLFGSWHLSEFTLAGLHKTKKPFEVKICKNRSFYLL